MQFLAQTRDGISIAKWRRIHNATSFVLLLYAEGNCSPVTRSLSLGSVFILTLLRLSDEINCNLSTDSSRVREFCDAGKFAKSRQRTVNAEDSKYCPTINHKAVINVA